MLWSTKAVSLFVEDEGEAERRELRDYIQAADGQIERGDYQELDDAGVTALAKDVHERGLRRLAQERKSSP